MGPIGVGDLQSSLSLQRRNAELRGQLNRLTEELSSGRTSDVSKATSGNLSPLAGIERSLSLVSAYDTSANVAATALSITNSALGTLRQTTDNLGAEILAATSLGDASLRQSISGGANAFEAALSALSARSGETYLFSGTATSQAPFLPAADILQELETATAGLTDAADFYAAVDDWFMLPGGGYETLGYLGGDAPVSGVSVSATEAVKLDLTAQDPALRATLRDLSVVALLDRDAFAGDEDQSRILSETMAAGLISGAGSLIQAEARQGAIAARVDQAQSQNASERFAFQDARNSVVGIDLFDTATQLEDAQTRLESLYLLTARMSRLSLTEYLR